jgi:putative heme-binding domain-containing protein
VPQKPEWKRPDQPPVKLTGYDFRFDPHTGQCEAITGNGQFGLTFDDWGNRFVCSNRNPCQHVVLENWHLQLNPAVAVPSVMHDVCAAGENSRIYPISKFWTTSQLHAGQFTAACGVTIFRGDGLGDAYYGNVFTCDPTGSLVHREILSPSGATFTGHPPYQEREFLATPDSWCRPVNLAHGPDGGLYVVDMYRAVIEHPDWVPIELKHRPDERYGDDRGRIYRIISKERAAKPKEPRSPQAGPRWRLDQTTTADRVALLSHPNAWQRDTAFRLLSQGPWSEIAFQLLKQAMYEESPEAKVAAIELCRRFAPERDYGRDAALRDESPAVRIAEYRHRRDDLPFDLPEEHLERVRFQQALALASAGHRNLAQSHWPLMKLIHQGLDDRWAPDDPWLRTAVLLAAREPDPLLVQELLIYDFNSCPIPGLEDFLEDLGQMIAVRGQGDEITRSLAAAVSGGDLHDRLNWALVRGLAMGFQRRGKSWPEFIATQTAAIQQQLSALATTSAKIALDDSQSAERRLTALQLLKYQVNPVAAPALVSMATGDAETPLRLAALDSLTGYTAPEISPSLLEAFPREIPAVRRAILDVLLANEERAKQLLAALEDQSLSVSEIDPARAARLTNHRSPEIKARAQKLFAAAAADRAAVLEKYKSAARMNADAQAGRIVFEKNCATCHRVAGIGVNVGPDVGDNYARTPDALLLSILDPNRAVDNNYFAYTVTTSDGRVLTGIITAETASSITLKQPEGKVEVVLREDIDELKASGQSLMPVGVEKNIDVEQMANLITFLKNWRYLDGNVPVSEASQKECGTT